MHPDHLSAAFDALQADAGVPRIRLHDLRHTAASLMLAAGISVHVVAARLGHATPTITLSVYAHVLPTQGIEAADVMGRIVGTEPGTEAAPGGAL
jgi:integrase